MMELKNTFPELELRGTGQLIFNTFIFVWFIFLIIILHSVEDFFFKPLKMLFCCYFISLPAFWTNIQALMGEDL